MFSHVKNSKLPLMELTKNDVPLEGDNLAQALLKTADALKERSQGEDVITVFELTRGSDIPAVVAWLLEWDQSLKEQDDDYVDEESQEELLRRYTFQQFSRLFKNQGKDPYEEWKFLQLAEDIKYTSTEEALRCARPHWLKWLRKANRHFDKVPQKIESEKIVLKVMGWFQGSLKTHLGNLRSESKYSQKWCPFGVSVYGQGRNAILTACGRICGLILALMIDGNDAIAKFNEAFECAQGFPWVDGAKVETLVTEFRKLLDRVKDIEENSRGNSKKGRFDTYFTAIREFILKKAMRMLIFEPWAITEVDRKMMFSLSLHNFIPRKTHLA